jgi:hypothetical protein
MKTFVLMLFGVSLTSVAAGAGPSTDMFRSVVTAANLDLGQTTEYPTNPELQTLEATRREAFFLSLLGVRGTREESRGGWRTGATEGQQRHLRVVFREPLPVGTILGAGGAVSYLKADESAPGDVNDDAQWVNVPLQAGQAGLRVWNFPPGLVTRALRFSFSDTPAPGAPTRSGFDGALILAERLHNLTPEAEAYASSEKMGVRTHRPNAYRVGNLINELGEARVDGVGHSYTAGEWTASPTHDVSREHPQWVVLSWPEAKTIGGVGFVNAFAKEIEIDALNRNVSGHPATAPESAWKKVGAVTWPVWWRPPYTAIQTPLVEPVTTHALRFRIVKALSDENADITSHFHRHPQDRNRLVRLGGVMAFTTLGDKPIPPRPTRADERPPMAVHYVMPYAGKVALAINDAQGRRIRNLLADEDRSAGAQVEPWDGRDEAGNVVSPGTYVVKGIACEPLHLAYQGTVNVSGNPPWNTANNNQRGPGGWLADHAPPNDITAIGDLIFVSSQVAESGHGILACDLDGNKRWGTHRFSGPNGLCYAGSLAHDGGKVYTVGIGWGSYLGITEIDPKDYSSRGGFIRLDYGSGDAATEGLSGLAARNGRLFVTFNGLPHSWTARSAINSAKVDAKETTLGKTSVDQMLGLLHARNEVVRECWHAGESANPVQHLRLAFTEPQAIGTVILPDAVGVSALKVGATFPGDLNDESQWTAFSTAPGPLHVRTAPAGQAQTRAVRFTFRNDGGTPWQAALRGAHLLPRRFESMTAGAAFRVSSGTVAPDGKWETVRESPITPENPATLTVIWPEPRTWRGLALLGAFAKRIEVDAYNGPANLDPAAATESAWSKVGEITPTVRWRPMYSDDYFDAGCDVTSRAIRLRVVEPWIKESSDIAYATKAKPTRAGLGGLVVLRHVGDDPQFNEIPAQRISIADIATGKWERHLAVAEPSWPKFDSQGRLLLVSRKHVVRLNLADGKSELVLPESALEDPRGIAFDAHGNLYVADGGPEVVKKFSPEGKLLRTIGEPGGRKLGTYNSKGIENPQGITIDPRGNLWVAERDYQPKRTSVWSSDGSLLREFIGPSAYGGGGQVDPRDPTRIYYGGVEYSLNHDTGAWALKRVLSRSGRPAGQTIVSRPQDASAGQLAFTLTSGNAERLPDKPIYLNGRQYMVSDPRGDAPLLLVGEFRKDRIVPLAVVGNADFWWPLCHDPALRNLALGRNLEDLSVVWSDSNGDGMPQPGEVELFDFRLDPTYWPTVTNEHLAVQMGGRVLKPAEFTACGAPVYKPVASALHKLPGEVIYATAVDRKGAILINGSPLTSLDATGKVAWTYPNRFVGVHGAQSATEPRPGQLAGTLGIVGQADLPGVGEVFMLSSNVGEWYLFTADGLLAATLWHDHRTPGVHSWDFPKVERGLTLDRVTLGGEHFGGSFQRADNGRYYLVAGHNHNSIVELTGLETMRRLESTFTVSDDDLAAVEAWRMHRDLTAARKAVPKVLVITAPPALVNPDGKLGEWDADTFTPIAQRGAFAVKADEKNLYVAWRVDSGQQLRNGGDEPNLLFKTGDSVDLQIGVDPDVDARRSEPAPGDQRLLVSVFQGKPIGVLYRHRVPGVAENQRIGFSSPWRTAFVDRIDRLPSENIGIDRTPSGYAVEAVVPLQLLGLEFQPGKSYGIDFGVLSADTGGRVTVSRTYWSNQATGLVNDVPGEIMLHPGLWGTATVSSSQSIR